MTAADLSPLWKTVHSAVYGKCSGGEKKVSNIQNAIEAHLRVKRRYKNMAVAFTYGRKLRYNELDDLPEQYEKMI